MYCQNCGIQNKEGAKFCKKCGLSFKEETQWTPNKQTWMRWVGVIALVMVGCLTLGVLFYSQLVDESSPAGLISTSNRDMTQLSSPSPVKTKESDAWNMEFIAQIGGTTNAVAVEDNFTYINIGRKLVVLDTMVPYSPTLISDSLLLDNFIMEIYAEDDYLYILAGGLHIIDVSDPSSPTEVGDYNSSLGEVRDVAIDGDFAFVAEGDSGLRVLDISDPADPTKVGIYDGKYAHKITLAGDFAFVTTKDGETYELQVINISNPSNPVGVGACEILERSNDIVVSDDHVLVTDNKGHLQIIDIADPSNPVKVGDLDPDDKKVEGTSVTVFQHYAYVAERYGSLRVIDLSDSSNPTEVASFDNTGIYEDVEVTDGYVFIAAEYVGLQVLEVSDHYNLRYLGNYDKAVSAYSLAGNKKYLYVATGSSEGLLVLTHSPLMKSVLTNKYNTGRITLGIAVGVDYAYVINHKGLRVFDIRDPTQIKLIGSPKEKFIYYSSVLELVGDYLYVVPGIEGRALQIWDVSSPSDPIVVGNYEFSGTARHFDLAGDYAFIADSKKEGLHVVDVSNPTKPTRVSFLQTHGSPRSVVVAEDYAYLTVYEHGLQVVNVSDPAHPEVVASCDIPANTSSVGYKDSMIYLVDYVEGLQIVDVSDPLHPIKVGGFETMYYGEDLALIGDFVFIAGGPGGVIILRIKN